MSRTSPAGAEKSSAEMALLAHLYAQPMHGYALHRRLAEPDGPGQVWGLKQGQVYAMLARLETAGKVTGEDVRIGGRPSRRVFRLTSAGKRAVKRWLIEPVQHARDMRQDFLVKLYFARQDKGDLALRLIRSQQEACRVWLQINRAMADDGTVTSYDGLIRSFRAGQIEAMLSWLDRSASVEEARVQSGTHGPS